MESGTGEAFLLAVGGIMLLLIGLAAVAVPIWAVIDIAQKPERAWYATGRSRGNWLLAVILSWFLGLGVLGAIVAVVYLAGPRRELDRAMRRT